MSIGLWLALVDTQELNWSVAAVVMALSHDLGFCVALPSIIMENKTLIPQY